MITPSYAMLQPEMCILYLLIQTCIECAGISYMDVYICI